MSNRTQPDQAFCKVNVKVSVEECQRCYVKTVSSSGSADLQPCEDYVFDRQYYQYTLVEEVCRCASERICVNRVTLFISSGRWSAVELFSVRRCRTSSSSVTWSDRFSSAFCLISESDVKGP